MIDADRLFALVDAALERRNEKRPDLYAALSARTGISADAWYRRVRRAEASGQVDLGIADTILVELDLSLDDLDPVDEKPPARRRGGGKPSGVYGKLTDAQVRACHVLYEQGLSMRQVADRVWERAGYASAAGCARALSEQFIRLGLPRRDRIEATKLRCTKHGLASKHGRRPGYQAYRRRVLAGIPDQPPCAGTTSAGKPCRHPAVRGSRFCMVHEPGRAEEFAAHLARGREIRGPMIGSRHPRALLDEDAARFILTHPEMSLLDLARRFGVARDTIWRVRSGRGWRHVAEQMEAAA